MINKNHGDRVWHQTWTWLMITWTWLMVIEYGIKHGHGHGSMGNKGISTINTKQIHVYHQEESKKSIRYQANNIEENIMNVKPPPKL